MDGSIADSTVLRMRTQLQRMHHASPTNAADGFLEELLKMPAAPVVEEPEAGQTSEPVVDAAPAAATTRSDKEKKDADKEPVEQTEHVDNVLPAIPMCYGPAPTPLPQTVEPEASVDAPVAIAEPAIAQSAVVNEQVAEPVATTATSEVADQVEEATNDPEVTADQLAPSVETNLQPVVKESVPKSTREIRRSKDARDKSDPPIERTPAVATQANAPKVDQPSAAKVVATKDETSTIEPSPAVDVNSATAQPKDVSEPKSARDNDRSQRDKWYEKPSTANGDESPTGPSVSASDDIKDQLNDPSQNDAHVVTASAESITDMTLAATDVSPMVTDAFAQATLDSAQMASDMLASAQANAAQTATTQSVAESSNAANIDAARGRSAMPSSAVSVGASAARGSVSGSAAASSQESSDAPREITQQERVRLVQRVARSFSRLGPEGGQVTLKLHPPQLGVLNVSIKIEGQTMTARLQTETSAARDAIVENLPVLRDRLSEQGIEIDKFQVEVGQQEDMSSSSGQAGSFTGSDANSQQSHSSAATELDYRRTSRGNASRQSAVGPLILEPRLQSWSAPGRSLDVKA